MNIELKELFDADRRDHEHVPLPGTVEYSALRERDAARRIKARTIVGAAGTLTPDDLYHAAWLFNHGDEASDARLAYKLSGKAAEMGLDKARWLSAASYDRWCMYRGKPQKFGTQIVPDGTGHRVWDVEPGTSDDERAALGVPPLQEQMRRAAELSLTEPQPAMDDAPQWLKDAIDRWRALS